MSGELNTCPFCGNLLEIVHKNGSKYVRCISGTCIFETARHGYHISDDELIKRCNRRPAEDALKAEVERLKSENKKLKAIIRKIKMHCEEEEQYSSIMRSGAYSSILRIVNTGDVVL